MPRRRCRRCRSAVISSPVLSPSPLAALSQRSPRSRFAVARLGIRGSRITFLPPLARARTAARSRAPSPRAPIAGKQVDAALAQQGRLARQPALRAFAEIRGVATHPRQVDAPSESGHQPLEVHHREQAIIGSVAPSCRDRSSCLHLLQQQGRAPRPACRAASAPCPCRAGRCAATPCRRRRAPARTRG